MIFNKKHNFFTNQKRDSVQKPRKEPCALCTYVLLSLKIKSIIWQLSSVACVILGATKYLFPTRVARFFALLKMTLFAVCHTERSEVSLSNAVLSFFTSVQNDKTLSFVIGEFISGWSHEVWMKIIPCGSLRNERANDIAIHEKVVGRQLYYC